MTLLASDRLAVTNSALHGPIAERWSPRAFDPSATIDDDTLTTLLEAARWAPSAANTQPWRFIAARRATPEFEAIVTSLVGFNKAWATHASVLVVAVAEQSNAEGVAHRWSNYDLGQSVAYLTIQAVSEGLHVHQMGGFDAEGLHAAFDLAPNLAAISVTAIGTIGDVSSLPAPLQEREVATRERKSLDEIVLVRA